MIFCDQDDFHEDWGVVLAGVLYLLLLLGEMFAVELAVVVVVVVVGVSAYFFEVVR